MQARRIELLRLGGLHIGGLLDVREAADNLGVSVRTVRRLVADRQVAFLRVRGSIRFELADLNAYRERQRVDGVEWE